MVASVYAKNGSRESVVLRIFQIAALCVALMVLPAGCVHREFLAVPEQSRVQVLNLESPGWEDFARCAIVRRMPCARLAGPTTYRSEQEQKDFEEFLSLFRNKDDRKYVVFEKNVAVASYIAEKETRVVDATQEKPASPPSRIAYKLHDCWFVLYSEDDNGLYTSDPNRATIRILKVFCDREKS